MHEITLPETKKRPALTVLVDDDTALKLAGLPMHATWNTNANAWYVQVVPAPHERIALARWIMDAGPDDDVDHANHDTLDNQRSNLRVASRQQNLQNRRGWSSTGFKGVRHRKGRPAKYEKEHWEAWIGIDGQHVYVGRADTPEAAARLYDEAALKHFGEFAHLNFPPRKRRTVEIRAV